MGYTVALTGGIGSGKVRSPTPSRSLGLRLSMPMLSPVRWSSPVPPALRGHCRPLWTTDDCPDGTLNRRLLRKNFAHVGGKSPAQCAVAPADSAGNAPPDAGRHLLISSGSYLCWSKTACPARPIAYWSSMCRKRRKSNAPCCAIRSAANMLNIFLPPRPRASSASAVADDVIENTGTPDAVASDVARLHEKYLTLASQAASQENS